MLSIEQLKNLMRSQNIEELSRNTGLSRFKLVNAKAGKDTQQYRDILVLSNYFEGKDD